LEKVKWVIHDIDGDYDDNEITWVAPYGQAERRMDGQTDGQERYDEANIRFWEFRERA
jgi:hypothetical protein